MGSPPHVPFRAYFDRPDYIEALATSKIERPTPRMETKPDNCLLLLPRCPAAPI